MKPPGELTDQFRACGLKVTPQRQSIFRAMYGNDQHPTAEAVHARVVFDMPTVSLRTVCATLSGTEIVFRGRCVECLVTEDGQHPGYRPGSAADRPPPAGSPPPGDTHNNG